MKPACNATIVYFHGNDWNGVPGRQRLLMEALSRFFRVVFLDGGRDGRFKITDYRPCENVVVVRGLASIVNSLARRGWNRLARFVATQLVGKHTRGSGRVIFWGAENFHRLQRFIPHDYFVHDSIDPCFAEDELADATAREAELARNADVVFCTAASLLDAARRHNERSYLIPNACSEDDFTTEGAGMPLPPALEGRSRPLVGYIGTLDSRLDIPFLVHAAARLQNFTFVMVGPILVEQEEALRPLRALPNVVFTGPKFGADARTYANAFDVCLIPFVPGRIGDALNPVKLYTYLAAGKRVVTTAIQECVRHESLVGVARSPEEFCQWIEQSAQVPSPEVIRAGVAFARENMWQQRASAVVDILAKLKFISPESAGADRHEFN